MKRIYVGALLCAILSLGLLTGCDQGVARSLGGDMTLELEPGQKLEMITWKDDDIGGDAMELALKQARRQAQKEEKIP